MSTVSKGQGKGKTRQINGHPPSWTNEHPSLCQRVEHGLGNDVIDVNDTGMHVQLVGLR